MWHPLCPIAHTFRAPSLDSCRAVALVPMTVRTVTKRRAGSSEGSVCTVLGQVMSRNLRQPDGVFWRKRHGQRDVGNTRGRCQTQKAYCGGSFRNRWAPPDVTTRFLTPLFDLLLRAELLGGATSQFGLISVVDENQRVGPPIQINGRKGRAIGFYWGLFLLLFCRGFSW